MFNSILRTYSPKDTNKARSTAYTFAVDFTIIHVNDGIAFAYRTIAERCQIPLSPKFVAKLADAAKYHSDYKIQDSQKRRRAELKGEKTKSKASKKRKSDDHDYSTGMGIIEGLKESQLAKRRPIRIVLPHTPRRNLTKRRVMRIRLK
jgi:hypothetical protein